MAAGLSPLHGTHGLVPIQTVSTWPKRTNWTSGQSPMHGLSFVIRYGLARAGWRRAHRSTWRSNQLLMESATGGPDLPQRIDLYVPVDEERERVRAKAHELDELCRYNSAAVQDILAKWPQADAWLPLMARVQPMVVLVNKAEGSRWRWWISGPGHDALCWHRCRCHADRRAERQQSSLLTVCRTFALS